ncbi:T9SS type A sorting domain-containing protein [Croceibacter atlanticus]|uniref:T9SS type A sorting domain-containing protein n=1 Tax=Croceibacter atlanticus TaxID=313588 RepID=UPI002E0E93C6|nr:T9SS type A sorting domain-containing protein [Croceibacter atlanticus]
MKCIITILSILISGVSLAQLSVKPTNTGDDTFIYVIDEILYVKEDVNLTKNVNDTLTEASIYLRREAQLIQGDGGNQLNKGDGLLSVYQEGTTNQWDYNNWTSPVSVAVNSSGVTLADGNATFGPSSTLFTPVDKTYSSPVKLIGGYESSVGDASATPDPEPLSLPSYWFFYYPTGDDYLGWQQVGGDDYTIPAGYGFTMKGVTGADPTVSDAGEGVVNNSGSAQRFDFRGRPNSGTIEIGSITPITPGHSVFIGNPYPSALDLSYFLLEHSVNSDIDDDNDPDTPDVPVTLTSCGSITRKDNTTGIAYFYDSDPSVQSHFLVDYQAGYEAFAPVDCGTTGMSVGATFIMYTNDGEPIANSETGVEGDARDRRYLPIAQGFFVETTSNLDNSFTFENRHRAYIPETASSNSTFHRNTSENITTENFDEDELIVIPKLKLNIELNHAYNRQISIGFWHNSSRGVDYAMDARLRNSLASDAAILNNNDKYYIDVRPFDVTEEIPLSLVLDSQMDVKFTATSFENFSTENVYILDSETGVYYDINYNSWTTTLQAGNYDGRFFLTFQEQEVLDTKDFAAENFDVFQNNSASQLEIRNPNALDLKSVALYDIAGKKVINEQNLEGQSVYTFSTRNLQEAIYVVNITTSDNITFSKKITVSNNR